MLNIEHSYFEEDGTKHIYESIDKLRELCRLLEISEQIADELEDNDIEDIMAYADKNGCIELVCDEYMSADTFGITVSTPGVDAFEHHKCLTRIDACGEGPFWEMPLEYAKYIVKDELESRGLNVMILTERS